MKIHMQESSKTIQIEAFHVCKLFFLYHIDMEWLWQLDLEFV